jgi:hypothetical protein
MELARLAVRARVFPVLEVEDGIHWRFTMDHPGDPVEPYVRAQGRFRHLTDEQLGMVQERGCALMELLKARTE